MKRTMIKTISLIMVLILLLTALASCSDAKEKDKETTPSINSGQSPEMPENTEEVEEDTTLVFTLDSLEPLSKEKQLEVEEAWNTAMSKELSWFPVEPPYTSTHRYYGTYNDCVVVFEARRDNLTWGIVGGGIYVGDQKIESPSLKKVWVYHNGEFIDIRVAYENKLLSDGDISAIVEYNNEFEEYEKK